MKFARRGNILNGGIFPEQVPCGDILDARVVEYRSQRSLESLDVICFRRNEDVEVVRGSRKSVQSQSDGAEHDILDPLALQSCQYALGKVVIHELVLDRSMTVRGPRGSTERFGMQVTDRAAAGHASRRARRR